MDAFLVPKADAVGLALKRTLDCVQRQQPPKRPRVARTAEAKLRFVQSFKQGGSSWPRFQLQHGSDAPPKGTLLGWVAAYDRDCALRDSGCPGSLSREEERRLTEFVGECRQSGCFGLERDNQK